MDTGRKLAHSSPSPSGVKAKSVLPGHSRPTVGAVKGHSSSNSPVSTVLSPELKDFIKRILVPILVERYIKDSKKILPESDGVVQ